MGKQVVMDVTFNLMSRLNPVYMGELLQKVSADGRVKSVVKEGQPTIHYIEIEEGEIDFKLFEL